MGEIVLLQTKLAVQMQNEFELVRTLVIFLYQLRLAET